MRDDVLAIPEHLRDALWRVETARIEPRPADGLAVCGMGGSAIGGDLAAAALGARLSKPLVVVRDYELPSWVGPGWTALCSSYSGDTEETFACFEAAGALGARRIVSGTGGALVAAAREAGDPVIGLPGLLPAPRVGVAYMFVCALEAARLSGVAPSLRAEVEAAADFLAASLEQLSERAAALAAQLGAVVPVVYGAGLTAPVARRWKAQLNENAKLPAFASRLPDADHNELCGWDGEASGAAGLGAILIEDPGQQGRLRRRFELTAEAIAASGATTVSIEAAGETRCERLIWAVVLGDLLSLELAAARRLDPLPIEAIDRFKAALGAPAYPSPDH